MIKLKEFPLQQECVGDLKGYHHTEQIENSKIPLWLARLAYVSYHKRWYEQSFEKLAEQGGFGPREFVWLLFGANDEAWNKVKSLFEESRELEMEGE